MSFNLAPAASFVVMTGLYVVGGFNLARFATTEDINALIMSVTAYVAANAMFVGCLRNGDYGMAMSLSSIAVLLGHVLVGALLLGERYTALQMVGIVAAVAAMALIASPSSTGGAS